MALLDSLVSCKKVHFRDPPSFQIGQSDSKSKYFEYIPKL